MMYPAICESSAGNSVEIIQKAFAAIGIVLSAKEPEILRKLGWRDDYENFSSQSKIAVREVIIAAVVKGRF